MQLLWILRRLLLVLILLQVQILPGRILTRPPLRQIQIQCFHQIQIFQRYMFSLRAVLFLCLHSGGLSKRPPGCGKLLLLLLALGIGLIPQSGPHLAVVYLFADGIIPFSTLLANCLLQEGHGGIPLMAESPKAFLRLKVVKLVLAAAIGLVGFATGW